MTDREAGPDSRARTWDRVATVALVIGALVTAYLVFLAFDTVY